MLAHSASELLDMLERSCAGERLEVMQLHAILDSWLSPGGACTCPWLIWRACVGCMRHLFQQENEALTNSVTPSYGVASRNLDTRSWRDMFGQRFE